MEGKVHSYGNLSIRYCPEQKTYGFYVGGRVFIFTKRTFNHTSNLKGEELKDNLKKEYFGFISAMKRENVSLSTLEKALEDMKTEL